jgi:hypothetical protein
MNLYGSYRKLLDHSRQSMIAAIEIYNKPKFDYREEICSMLLGSTWELFMLAVLSKNRQRIYEEKKRDEEYRTLTFERSSLIAKMYFPIDIHTKSVLENISLLRKFRNISAHYYHEEQDKHAIYALAQASIRNYRDLLLTLFGYDIGNEVSIVLLPLSFNQPPDFVSFLGKTKQQDYSPYIRKLLASLESVEMDIEGDTSRFVTQCHIKLETTRSIRSSDIVAYRGDAPASSHVLIKPINPDDSHPFYQKDIVGDLKNSRHKKLTVDLNTNDFQALLWKYDLKKKSEYCWVSTKGGSPRYSQSVINFINELTKAEILSAKAEYNSKQKLQGPES